MSIEWVLDASMLAKCLFPEAASSAAVALVGSAYRLHAPDFIFVELASICAKKARRGQETAAYAAEALERGAAMRINLVPAASLWRGAYPLAVERGVSVYDGLYLALAMRMDLKVLTADLRLASRAARTGLGALVEGLADG